MEKAQKGDLIRIVKAELNGNRYDNGDILTVIDVEEDWGGVDTDLNDEDGNPVHVFHREYVIHRKAGEDDDEHYAYQMPYTVVEDSEQDALAHHQSEVLGEEIAELDAVNSPNHYTQGKFETIEIIEEITKGYSDGYVAYCVGNALKYLARAPFKHGEPSEDLSKAAKYLAFANEYLDAKSTQD